MIFFLSMCPVTWGPDVPEMIIPAGKCHLRSSHVQMVSWAVSLLNTLALSFLSFILLSKGPITDLFPPGPSRLQNTANDTHLKEATWKKDFTTDNTTTRRPGSPLHRVGLQSIEEFFYLLVSTEINPAAHKNRFSSSMP